MKMTIFDILYPKYKIVKPIRLIEFFAGYGSQALALKYLGVDFEHWKICEWAVKSIQAYKDIHFTNNIDQNELMMEKEEIIQSLYKLGISSNYNEPMTLEQIKRLPEYKLREIMGNIFITHNLVNIQQVKGKDLEIVDTDKYDYILTYSFPCQDLSLAGKGKGMKDTTTRSGMLWEVERILDECKQLGTLPQVLLMENVPQVHGEGNVDDFNKWQFKLEELGYKNYWQDLIATDYEIPQTRNRCFMVSILGDYSYSFPGKKKLNIKLKDLLEDEVDEKYYLSDKQIKDIKSWNAYEKPLENMEKIDKSNIAPTLTTRSGAYAAGMVSVKDTQNYIEWYEKGKLDIDCRAWKEEKIIDSLMTTPEKNKILGNSDCLSEYVGTYQYSKSDNFMKGKDRLQFNKNVADTILTTPKEGVVIVGNYSPSKHNDSRIVDKEYLAPTVMENHRTITAAQISEPKIRKLTPKECFRLMGVKDKDYENVKINQSDSSLYHLAGDSIVVNVLMAIFKELL